MRVVAVDVFALRIPFVRAFAHARYTRAESDAVVVRLRDGEGYAGYGEGLPREYVSGEDVASMVGFIRDRLAPRVFAAEVPRGAELFGYLRERFPEWSAGPAGGAGGIRWNAAFCAVELALVDLALRREGDSLADYLPPVGAEVRYDGVIASDDPATAAALARRYVGFGIDRLKVKVGTPDDVARLTAVREAVGDGPALRVDANGAWTVDEALRCLAAFAPFGVESVEQPVAAADLAGLRRVREEAGLAVVADEALVSAADAEALVAERACDAFNVRVSKCGGLTGSLLVAGIARAAGIAVQVGAQVGETAILSAAGRHLAAYLAPVAAVEGSFGTLLLTEDVAAEEVAFGYGGLAPLLTGEGLGVRVREAGLERFAVVRVHLEPES
jgi:muconate cycloisomerase